MKVVLTKKDVIALNQEFDYGKLHNEASLDFALNQARKTHNWVRALAFLVRAILVDHVFEEANKRTTALLVKTYIEFQGYKSFDDKIVKLVKKIILKNITSLKNIEEMLNDVIH